MSTNQGGNSQN